MGSIDYGIQKLSYDYNQEATAKLFNNVTYNLAPRGIYSGYTLSKASDTSVIISSGVCYIQDSTNETGVRIESTSNYALTVSSTNPFIVFRFEWVDAKNNFMDYLALSYEDLLPEDIVVGRCVYAEDGVTLSSTFDYTRRTINFLDKTKTQDSYLRIYPTEPASNKVSITSGVLNSSSGNLVVSGGTYPVAGLANTTNGRIDLVYVTEEGAIDFIQGVDASSPVAPRYGNRKVIAEIRRGAARTNIKGNEIFRVIGNFDVTPIVSDLLIEDAGSYYTSTNVEDALQELASLGFTFTGDKVFNGSVTINASSGKVALKTKGVSGYNIEEARKADNTLIQYTDQNGKFYNTVGIDAPLSDTYNVFSTDKYQEALNQLAGATFTFKGVKTFESSPLVPNNTFGDSSTKAANTKFVQDAINYVVGNNPSVSTSSRIFDLTGDRVPAIPDDPAGVTYLQDAWATTDGWIQSEDVTLSATGGALKISITTEKTSAHVRKTISGVSGKLATFRIRVNKIPSTAILRRESSPYTVYTNFKDELIPGVWVNISANVTEEATVSFLFNTTGAPDFIAEIDWVYIGTGAYLSKLVDRAGVPWTNYGAVPVDGPFGKGLQFNGAQYLRAPGPMIGTTGTIAIYPGTVPAGAIARLICNRDISTFTGIDVFVDATNTLFFRFGDGSANQTINCGLLNVPIGISFNSSAIKVYRDGIIHSTTTPTITPTAGVEPLTIGRVAAGTTSYYFTGTIYALRADSRVWTDEEIARWSRDPYSEESIPMSSTPSANALVQWPSSGNFGSGSGLDTDLVRGTAPATGGLSLLTLSTLGSNWLTALAASAGAGILAQLLTVDGSGSGLDADKLRNTTPGAGGLSLLTLSTLGTNWSTALASTLNATALAFLADGGYTANQPIDMNNFQIQNLADPTADDDAATYGLIKELRLTAPTAIIDTQAKYNAWKNATYTAATNTWSDGKDYTIVGLVGNTTYTDSGAAYTGYSTTGTSRPLMGVNGYRTLDPITGVWTTNQTPPSGQGTFGTRQIVGIPVKGINPIITFTDTTSAHTSGSYNAYVMGFDGIYNLTLNFNQRTSNTNTAADYSTVLGCGEVVNVKVTHYISTSLSTRYIASIAYCTNVDNCSVYGSPQIGFWNCKGIKNCTEDINENSSYLVYNPFSKGYESCYEVYNCISNGATVGFYVCVHLDNCLVYPLRAQVSSQTSFVTSHYEQCSYLTNCDVRLGYRRGASSIQFLALFHLCENLSNIRILPNTLASSQSFEWVNSSSAFAIFFECYNISNSKLESYFTADSTQTIASLCSNISNLNYPLLGVINSCINISSSYVYKFSDCQQISSSQANEFTSNDQVAACKRVTSSSGNTNVAACNFTS